MMAPAKKRRSSNLALVVVLAGFTAAAAAAGCDCQGGPPINKVAPVIKVTPAQIDFGTVAVNAEADQVVTIANDGNDRLTLKGDPTLTEGSEDTNTELALRSVLTPVDCATGASRSATDPHVLQPGDCVTVTVVYVPKNLGKDTGTLAIKSNDTAHAEVDVPINAEGSAPDIEVCLMPGTCVSQKVCNTPGQNMQLPFPLTAINTSVQCPVVINNVGKLPLKNLQWAFKSGNRRKDYSLDPPDLKATGDLAAGAGIQGTVTFDPKSGGDKPALLEITSSDPDEGAVDIEITGKGDGPKICPDPVPVVDFGQVAVGATGSKDVTLTNCGTMELDVTKLAVQDQTGAAGSPEFAMGGSAPATPIVLAPGASATVPVEFTPDKAQVFNGRLYLESNDAAVPSGWISLTGEGVVPPSCQLQAATTTVDFGQAATGFPATKQLAVSNPGQLDCTGVTAQITAGAGVSFSITGFPAGGPPWTLHPGDIVMFTLQYNPADATGPDTGTLELGANELTTPIDVALQGTPSATPQCSLAVTPHTGNFSFGACAVLSFTPRVAEFGAVRVGQDKTLTASLENTGSIPCHVSSVKMVGTDISTFFTPDPNYTLKSGATTVIVGGNQTNTIDPGQVGQVQVDYKPTTETQDCGGVQINTDDPSADGTECGGLSNPNPQPGCYMVYLDGQGVRSAIQVIPSEMKFGVITVGCSSLERKVTVYNIGQASMNITDIYIDPPGKGQPPSGPFTLTSVPPLPVAVPGAGQVSLKIKYRPPDTNAHNALLAIESDAANSSLMTVPLSGQGTNDSHQTDTFQQLSQPMVDVLWMIDDSCSMSEEQSGISNSAPTFMNRALALNTDFQIGVVTTDMDNPAESGRLQSRNGAPKIIKPTDANPVSEFSDNAVLGTNGSGTEKGLASVNAALSDPLINDPAANQGFLRQDAKLVVIAVSDEDDQSTPPVDFFVDFLKNIKGYRNADLMSFSAVVGFNESTQQPDSCTSANGDAVPGPRYVEVADRTGGLKRSICDTNWGGIADDLGLNTFGAKSQFFLTREAVASSIVVHVDGTLVAGGSTTWSYDSPSNSIIFDAGAVPSQGATITVDYDTVCH